VDLSSDGPGSQFGTNRPSPPSGKGTCAPPDIKTNPTHGKNEGILNDLLSVCVERIEIVRRIFA
jgi:hypothetical protein